MSDWELDYSDERHREDRIDRQDALEYQQERDRDRLTRDVGERPAVRHDTRLEPLEPAA